MIIARIEYTLGRLHDVAACEQEYVLVKTQPVTLEEAYSVVNRLPYVSHC